jgi:signal transduction histidine kinase
VAGADERGRAPAIVAAEAHALDDWISGARSGPRLVRVSPAGDDGVETTLRRMGARVCFPLWTETGALGVLVLGARVAGQPFLPDHLELLTVLANQVAVVAENVRLHEALNASNLKLSESREMLQRASRLSTVGTLAAGLVHEIRNPLAAVQTFLQILPERLTDPEITTDFREVALNEVRRVSTLVGELLNVARAQTVKFERTRLDHVVDQVIRLLRVAAERRQIELRRSGNPLPEAEADPARLTQALLNLVLNAIEASAPGTAVTIDTQVRVDEAGRTTAAFAVHDRGPGVPLDRREQIFQPFATTKASGTGLGLAVTRQIVADHGGRIDVDSEDGAGATFTVSVPLEHSPTLQ